MKEYKLKDIQRILKDNGYILTRTAGDHYIYAKPDQPLTFSIPSRRDLPRPMVKRLLKEHGIVI